MSSHELERLVGYIFDRPHFLLGLALSFAAGIIALCDNLSSDPATEKLDGWFGLLVTVAPLVIAFLLHFLFKILLSLNKSILALRNKFSVSRSSGVR